ncbi:MAG TPA: DUF481 domain-containing protein [Chryseolinea sp.]
MCLRFFALTTLILWSSVAFPQAKDTLYFYNETKIVGELLAIRLGRVEFDADGIGILKIKNSKIGSINATSRNFRIETVDGREVQGFLMRSEKPGMVVINTNVKREETSLDSIANLLYYGKTMKSRFTGNVSSGFTYTKSSRIGRLNFDGNIKYNTAKGATQLQGDMIITSDSVDVEAERANLAFSHEHTFAPLWGAVIILKYQRNVELGLQRRWQQGFGIGREFLISRRQQATVISGIAINQELNQEGAEVNNTEVMFQANYDLYSFVNPNITVSLVESAFISLTEEGRVRIDGDITLDYEIISDFYITLEFYHSGDSRSPGTNEPNIDYGFVAGLRYKF